MRDPMIDAYDRVPAKVFLRPAYKRQKPQSGTSRWWRKYHRYIHGRKWKKFAAKIRAERIICERCGQRGTVVHHLSYANLFHEKREDVKLLCHPCHQLMHPDKVI